MAAMWSLATISCMWARGYGALLTARAMVGLGEAGYGSVGAAVIASHFPARRRGAVLAAFFASASVGSVLGVLLGGVIASRFGWQAAFGVVGIPGLILALLYLKVRDYRTVARTPTLDAKRQSLRATAAHIVKVLTRAPTMLWVCIGSAVLALLGFLLSGVSEVLLIGVGVFYGGLVFTLYGLSVAHVNDMIDASQLLEVTGGLLLLHGIGSALGPTLAGMLMEFLGSASLMLYFGTVLVAWWLIAAASGPDYFETANWVFGSRIGRIVLFGMTWALVQHLLGGLRHFMWDLGYGFDKHFTTRVAKITFVAAPVITILIWVAGYMAR